MGRLRKSFKDSLKALEADIQLANTLALDYPQECDGGCLQMRLSYSPATHSLLFLVQWTDCHVTSSLGLLRVLIYKAYVDGKTTMSIQERKASIKEFYAVSARFKRGNRGNFVPRSTRKMKNMTGDLYGD